MSRDGKGWEKMGDVQVAPPIPRHFYKPTSLRSLDGIRADLEALQEEAEGLLERIISLGIAGGDK
jgi:hypothetical protein